jgi:hypothetical protein
VVFKGLLLLILLIPAIGVTYYFAVALPNHNKATLDFEKQKYADQKAGAELEAAQKQRNDEERGLHLDSCLATAEAQYTAGIRSNGTRSGNGGYSVPTAVMTEIQHKKDSEVAECHREYGR